MTGIMQVIKYIDAYRDGDAEDSAELRRYAEQTAKVAPLASTPKLRSSLRSVAREARPFADDPYLLDMGPLLDALGYPLDRCGKVLD